MIAGPRAWGLLPCFIQSCAQGAALLLSRQSPSFLECPQFRAPQREGTPLPPLTRGGRGDWITPFQRLEYSATLDPDVHPAMTKTALMYASATDVGLVDHLVRGLELLRLFTAVAVVVSHDCPPLAFPGKIARQ